MLIDILEPMGAQFDRLRCEVCQNLFLRPMNTGFLRHAVATVLTVYGIETYSSIPMASAILSVATVLTVYGIETNFLDSVTAIDTALQQCLPFTVLKPYIEDKVNNEYGLQQCLPFTVLKRSIVSCFNNFQCCCCNSAYRLRY